MKTNFLKFSIITLLLVIGLGLVIGLAVTENKKAGKNKWDLLTVKDGVVYRINKQSGEVSLIVGTQSVGVEGTKDFETSDMVSNAPVAWPDERFDNLDIALKLKTEWRRGKLYFVLKTTKSDKFEDIRLKSPSAQFTLRFFDKGDFIIFAIPVTVSEMIHYSDNSNEMNGSVDCGYDTFKNIEYQSCLLSGFHN